MTGSSFYTLEKTPDGRSGGTTQAETRVYNERLILSLVRRRGPLSKVELTRLTGLSAMTITTLVNRAADLGFLSRQEPLRGRLGQPSVPYALNPSGVFSIGLKIDRRNADLAIVDFTGNLLAFERLAFAYPTPEAIMAFARDAIPRLLAANPDIDRSRIAGLGIASPFQLWDWTDEIGAPPGALSAWRDIDVRAELDREFAWPVFLFNDAMVAAGAELMFGAGTEYADFIYIYVGYLVGGALVLDHHLHPGRNKRAGAIGEIVIPAPPRSAIPTQTFIAGASLYTLANTVESPASLWDSSDQWNDFGAPLADWLESAAWSIAHATHTSAAVLDVDNAVIDGAMPPAIRAQLAKRTREHLAQLQSRRLVPFTITEGAFGHLAPAIGGATIPLIAGYSNDKDVLFKE